MILGTWRAVAFTFCGALGAVALAHAAPVETRTPIERPPAKTTPPPKPNDGLTCQGGPERLADIELIPDAVISKGGRERIEYHAEIVGRRGLTLGIAWDADIVDDRGRVVVAGLDTGQATKRAGDTALTRALSSDLPDGFFAVRVRAAIAAAGEPSTVIEAAQHVEVRGGKWAELTQAEWQGRSSAREGFTEAQVKAMGLLP
jgi:hypothetical protein